MRIYSKRLRSAYGSFDRMKKYSLNQAIGLLKQMPPAKFNESADLAFYLGVDPKQSDQMVRGTVLLPHGTGKSVRVIVFCKGELERVAREEGVEVVGGEDLVKKIEGGWMDFDVVISTPDMMKIVSRLGKILGPKGLMPSPKAGTVTMDLAKTIKEIKAGRVEFKTDKQGNMNVAVGKLSFSEQALCDNSQRVIEAVIHSRPVTVKGHFIQGIVLSSTMGPGFRLELADLNVN